MQSLNDMESLLKSCRSLQIINMPKIALKKHINGAIASIYDVCQSMHMAHTTSGRKSPNS